MTSPSSTSSIPPPLPISLVTTLLPYLIPPSPLPQEFLSKSLLQRLLYLPPSSDDLDSHLSPFPSSSSPSTSSSSAPTFQPISSRLQELSHDHQLSSTRYTKEGEDVYAKIVISPEHVDDSMSIDKSVEVWFEYESPSTGGAESRGWVYHSSRLPQPTSVLQFVSDPSLLSTLTKADEVMDYGHDHDEENLDGQAPEGYWTAFDSPPSTNSPSLPHTDLGEQSERERDDAYWSQYSRPPTAPITPGIHTPFHPNTNNPQKPLSQMNTKISQEETARKLTESLQQLGLASNGYTKFNENVEGKRGFWNDSHDDHDDLNAGHDSKEKHEINNVNKNVNGNGNGNDESERKTQQDIKDRLKCKISASLNALWKEYTTDSNEDELEINAMNWLKYARLIIEPSSTTDQPEGNVFPTSSMDDIKDERVKAKFEVLWDMFQVLNQDSQQESFFRLVEGVIRRQPDLRGEEDLDEVMRQRMYYE
ncbi:uncharacterized protein IL334_004473 [Kwoniella shivajii]|uniref:Uncharacterized protein n=1 Tax=Kwoniella shivajii TaxID=564305 RepID=A0ABZ1D0T9_9TREE|nr:hypothetical protein IL334_004473 [Kwoniella shivajii]